MAPLLKATFTFALRALVVKTILPGCARHNARLLRRAAQSAHGFRLRHSATQRAGQLRAHRARS